MLYLGFCGQRFSNSETAFPSESDDLEALVLLRVTYYDVPYNSVANNGESQLFQLLFQAALTTFQFCYPLDSIILFFCGIMNCGLRPAIPRKSIPNKSAPVMIRFSSSQHKIRSLSITSSSECSGCTRNF